VSSEGLKTLKNVPHKNVISRFHSRHGGFGMKPNSFAMAQLLPYTSTAALTGEFPFSRCKCPRSNITGCWVGSIPQSQQGTPDLNLQVQGELSYSSTPAEPITK
jgi:hypothetical protein